MGKKAVQALLPQPNALESLPYRGNCDAVQVMLWNPRKGERRCKASHGPTGPAVGGSGRADSDSEEEEEEGRRRRKRAATTLMQTVDPEGLYQGCGCRNNSQGTDVRHRMWQHDTSMMLV